jgi:hypothetical protein
MAVSALSAISNATAFIQPPQVLARQTRAELFARALDSTLSGPPVSPAALAAVTEQRAFVDNLERALFRDLSLQVASADRAGLTALLDRSLTATLGLGGALPDALPAVLAGASAEQSLALTASFTALLNTLQLLGSETGDEPALVDLFA